MTKIAVALIFLTILVCHSLRATGAPAASPGVISTPANPAVMSSVPFRYADDKIVIQAIIDGHGPFELAIDTGAETVLLSKNVAALCKLPVKMGAIGLAGTTGSYIPVQQAKVGRLQIGSATLLNPICTVSPQPIPVDGYIGAPLLNAYAVQIDPSDQTVHLGAPGSYPPDTNDLAVLTPFGQHRVPVVKGDIDGIPALFEVDTGSTFAAELTPRFVHVHSLSERFRKIGAIMTRSLNGPAVAMVYDAPNVTIGTAPGIRIKSDVPTIFLHTATPSGYDGRIGAPLLRDYIITFDYAHSRMYIRPTQAAAPQPAVTAAPPAAPPPQ